MEMETIERIVGYVAEIINLGAASYGIYWLCKSETSLDNQEYLRFNDNKKENGN